MKCHVNSCQDEASHRVHWPSGQIDVCPPCAARWMRVAEAMGFAPHVESIEHARLAKALLEDDTK